MNYFKKCNCGECSNSMNIEYFGKNVLFKESKLSPLDKLTLDTVYFTFKKSSIRENSEGINEFSIRVSPKELPEIIKVLQEAYKEYEEVQEILKKNGRLEVNIQK